MNDMKKTLLIYQKYPLPENDGSNMRTMNFVRYFREQGSIDIAYCNGCSDIQVGNTVFSNEYLLRKKPDCKNLKTFFINRIIKGIPIPIYHFNNESQRLILRVIKKNDYDYILVRYLNNSSILLNLDKKYKMRTIIDFDDILSGPLYETMFGSVDKVSKKVAIEINRRLLKVYEKKSLNFGASIFCSEKDRARLVKRHRTSDAFIVPNVYTNDSFEKEDFGDRFEAGDILLFIGTLGYKPNVNGIIWFINSIYPDFKKEYPNAKLLIVGKSPSPIVRKICESTEGIELHSDVPDIKEYYKQCRAIIVPLLEGSGTRIKILEAALANTPVLSTPIGAEGLNLVDDNEILIFENSREFCDKYKKLENHSKYSSLIKNAKHAVEKYYSVQEFNNAMRHVLQKIDQKNLTSSESYS